MVRITGRPCWVTTSTRAVCHRLSWSHAFGDTQIQRPMPGPLPSAATHVWHGWTASDAPVDSAAAARWQSSMNGRQERATWSSGSRRFGSRRSGATASRLQTVCSPDVYGPFERWGTGKRICAGLFRWDLAADCLLRPDRSAAVDNGLGQPEWHERLPCGTC